MQYVNNPVSKISSGNETRMHGVRPDMVMTISQIKTTFRCSISILEQIKNTIKICFRDFNVRQEKSPIAMQGLPLLYNAVLFFMLQCHNIITK